MIKVFSSADVRAMDRAAIEGGIPGTVLMESAARALFNTLERALDGIRGRFIVIFCGSGNNGGDGFAFASQLLENGAITKVIFTGEPERINEDCRFMRERFESLHGITEDFHPDCLIGADAAVDAMYGTGFRGKLTGDAHECAKLINDFEGFRLAADIPSGVYSDHGGMCDDAVHADATVTFSFPKPSCLLMPAAANCGRLIVADIGIPEKIASGYSPVFHMTDENTLRVLPRRVRNTHKGNYGHALIVAGSVRYTGAAYLAAQAAVVSGSGRVTVAVPSSIHGAMAQKLTEAMVYSLPDSNYIGGSSLYDILSLCSSATAVLIGPGLGRESGTASLVYEISGMINLPVVFDADGINTVAQHIDILPRMVKTPILTPHDNEFKTLFGESPPDGARARLMAVSDAAVRTGSVILLKGHRTIIASPDGRVAVNSTGNPGMAKGGSGDVLAGLVTSFIAQGVEPFEAACAAAWLHGAAGDELARDVGEYGMTVSGMLNVVPRLLKCRNSIYYF